MRSIDCGYFFQQWSVHDPAGLVILKRRPHEQVSTLASSICWCGREKNGTFSLASLQGDLSRKDVPFFPSTPANKTCQGKLVKGENCAHVDNPLLVTSFDRSLFCADKRRAPVRPVEARPRHCRPRSARSSVARLRSLSSPVRRRPGNLQPKEKQMKVWTTKRQLYSRYIWW